MLKDSQYRHRPFALSEIEHRYGNNVHILNDPTLFTTLARLSEASCVQPMVNLHLNTIYRELVRIVTNHEFPMVETEIKTRMVPLHPEGAVNLPILDPSTKVVCVSLARAGIVPSQICFDAFNYILSPEGVRQDHISINRATDENQKVVGINLGGLKIGGDINDRILVIPDPMGATGSTIKTALEIYRGHGKMKKAIALHLIVTPEYLKMLTKQFPDLVVYAIRLDRGLSPQKVLDSIPGTYWDEERGLNSKQYIVPGAGGLGEVINNAYV